MAGLSSPASMEVVRSQDVFTLQRSTGEVVQCPASVGPWRLNTLEGPDGDECRQIKTPVLFQHGEMCSCTRPITRPQSPHPGAPRADQREKERGEGERGGRGREGGRGEREGGRGERAGEREGGERELTT